MIEELENILKQYGSVRDCGVVDGRLCIFMTNLNAEWTQEKVDSAVKLCFHNPFVWEKVENIDLVFKAVAVAG